MGGCTSSSSVKIDESRKRPVDERIQLKTTTINRARTNVKETKRDNFIYKLLKCHNELRKKYNLPELVENLDLEILAEIYAEEFIKNNEKYTYQPNIYKNMYLGENVIVSDSKEPEEIFNKILMEEKNYETNDNKSFKKAGHFTQVIWKDTTDIGIGIMADEEQKKFCTVILYYPTGNVL